MPHDALEDCSDVDAAGGLNPARAASLLQQLKESHHALEAALADIDFATTEDEPDLSRYPHARWRLSTARRQRRTVTSTIYTEVRSSLRPEQAEALEQWRAEDDRRLQASAQHVRIWTNNRMAADWQGYRAASDTLRRSLRGWIAAERAFIYPLLESRSRPCGRLS
jgi:hypothetical protein